MSPGSTPANPQRPTLKGRAMHPLRLRAAALAALLAVLAGSPVEAQFIDSSPAFAPAAPVKKPRTAKKKTAPATAPAQEQAAQPPAQEPGAPPAEEQAAQPPM